MRTHFLAIALAIANFGFCADAAPLAIDLTIPITPPVAAPFGPGTTKSPKNGELTVDQQSFFLKFHDHFSGPALPRANE